MSIFKVHVPLTQEGQHIFVEWLKLLQALETATSGGTDLATLEAAVASMESAIASQQTDLSALDARVQKLENAYHV